MSIPDFYPVPTPPPDEGEQGVRQIPLAWLPVVVGLLDKMRNPSQWDTPPDDITAQVDDLIWRLSEDFDMPPIFPTNHLLLPPQWKVTNGADFEFNLNTASKFNGLWRRSASAQFDGHRLEVLLAAGDYVLEYSHAKSSASGIVNIACVEILFSMNVDQYNSTTQLNQIATGTFTLAEPMTLTWAMAVNSKNAASTGYVQNWHYLVIRQA